MSNTWKFAMIGVAITTVTALTSSMTTAYFMRPSPAPVTRATDGTAPTDLATAPPEADPMSQPRRGVATYVREAARPAVVSSHRAPRPRVRTVAASSTEAPTVTAPAQASAPSDCATGTERAMKIAKPGALGALVGAGLGAVGGAIANGGKGAGKGALIGGIAGVAAGGAYGAYKTKNECGTILGKSGATLAPSAPSAQPSPAPQAALMPASATPADQSITVYPAR